MTRNKRLIGFFAGFFLVVQLPFSALAAKKAIDAQEDASTQLLTNPGLESGKAGWVASSGSTFTLASSGGNLLSGKRSGVFNSTASSQTILSPPVVVDSSLKKGIAGNQAGFSCLLKGSATDYKIQAWDGTNVKAERVVPALSTARRIGVIAPVVAGTTVYVRLISASDAADLAFDDCRVDSDPFQDMAQSYQYGTLKYAANSGCDWTTNVLTYGTDFAADTDCSTPVVTGRVSAPGTKVPQIVLSNHPAGTFTVFAIGKMFSEGNAIDHAYRLVDSDGTQLVSVGSLSTLTDGGSNNSQPALTLVGSVTYAAAGSHNIKIQARGDGTVIQHVNGTGDGSDLTFVVMYSPLGSDLVQRFDTVGQTWSGYHAAACYFPRTNTAYGDLDPDSTCSLVQQSNSNFGSVTSYMSGGDFLPGLVITPNTEGKYRVCAKPIVYSGSTGIELSVRLRDAVNTLDEDTKTQDNANSRTSMNLCGHFTASSTSPATIWLEGKASANAIEINGSPEIARTIQWNIEKITENTPMPVAVGGVVAPVPGPVTVCAFEFGGASADSICSTDPCTIRKNICGAVVVNRLAGGDYEATFPGGTFSSAPVCTSNGFSWPTITTYASLITSTSSTVRFQNYDDGNTPRDVQGHIMCIGPH